LRKVDEVFEVDEDVEVIEVVEIDEVDEDDEDDEVTLFYEVSAKCLQCVKAASVPPVAAQTFPSVSSHFPYLYTETIHKHFIIFL